MGNFNTKQRYTFQITAGKILCMRYNLLLSGNNAYIKSYICGV